MSEPQSMLDLQDMSSAEKRLAWRAMRARNGAVEAATRDVEREAEKLICQFCLHHDITRATVVAGLAESGSAIREVWLKEYRKELIVWCADCFGYHRPTEEHPLCLLCETTAHAPMPEGVYYDYRGWRFTLPYLCMACGVEICYRQWGFARVCGSCDVGNSPTRRVLGRFCFAGPHEKLEAWDAAKYDLDEKWFLAVDARADYYPAVDVRGIPEKPQRRRRKIP